LSSFLSSRNKASRRKVLEEYQKVVAETSSRVRLATLNWDCPAGDTAIRAGLYGAAVLMPAGVGPLVAAGALTGVAVAVGVDVFVGGAMGVLLGVDMDVLVADGMAVGLGASVAVLVADEMAVGLGAGVAVLVAVGGDTVFVGTKIGCGERLGTTEGCEAAPEGIVVLGACWVTTIIVGAP
jgi:hypothetical protein